MALRHAPVRGVHERSQLEEGSDTPSVDGRVGPKVRFVRHVASTHVNFEEGRDDKSEKSDRAVPEPPVFSTVKLDELEAHKRGHISIIRGVLLRSASNDLAILNDLELRVTLFAFRYILVEATDKVDGEDRAHDTKEEHHGDSDKVYVFRRRQHAGHGLHSHRPSLVVWGEGFDVNILTDEPKNGDNSNSKLQKCATVPLRHRHLVIIGTVGGVLRVAREDGVDPVDNAKAVKKDKAEGDHSRVGIKKGGERVSAQKKANETGQEAHPVISVRGKIFHPRTSNVPARHESQGHCDELKGEESSECSIHGVRDEGSDDGCHCACVLFQIGDLRLICVNAFP